MQSCSTDSRPKEQRVDQPARDTHVYRTRAGIVGLVGARAKVSVRESGYVDRRRDRPDIRGPVPDIAIVAAAIRVDSNRRDVDRLTEDEEDPVVRPNVVDLTGRAAAGTLGLITRARALRWFAPTPLLKRAVARSRGVSPCAARERNAARVECPDYCQYVPLP